jgi:hypothetical protein
VHEVNLVDVGEVVYTARYARGAAIYIQVIDAVSMCVSSLVAYGIGLLITNAR